MASSESAEGQVISKVATILMAYLYGESHSLTELTAVCDLPLSTTHRLVNELARCKIPDRADSGEYRVGIPVRKIGASKRCAIDLEERHTSHYRTCRIPSTSPSGWACCTGVKSLMVEKLTGRCPVTGFQEARHLPAHAESFRQGTPGILTTADRPRNSATRPHRLHALHPPGLPERFRRALAMTRQPTRRLSSRAHNRRERDCSTRAQLGARGSCCH